MAQRTKKVPYFLHRALLNDLGRGAERPHWGHSALERPVKDKRRLDLLHGLVGRIATSRKQSLGEFFWRIASLASVRQDAFEWLVINFGVTAVWQ